MLDLGIELVPALAEARILRIFCGVRPLDVPPSVSGAGGREISRGFALLDHESLDHVKGFVSIVGGKVTTYRLMAKAVSDLVAQKLRVDVPCTTHETLLRPHRDEAALRKAHRLLPLPVVEMADKRLGPNLAKIVSAIEIRPELAEVVCECELVTRAELEFVLGNETSVPAKTINDVGRRTRLGLGTCQGTSVVTKPCWPVSRLIAGTPPKPRSSLSIISTSAGRGSRGSTEASRLSSFT